MNVNDVKIGDVFKDTEMWGTVRVTDIFISPHTKLHVFELQGIDFDGTYYGTFRDLMETSDE